MNVLVWGREGSQERARADGFAVAESKDALFEQSDVLSVHLRLNDETRGIVSVADLTRMKPTALFVNTSRAELVEENGLVTSLNRGRPGMAAIDVFETEPILQGHTLLRMENCICTPHIGYVERESYEMYFGFALQNILDVLQGNVDSMVNPTALAPALIRA